MFVDSAQVVIKAGDGGNGVVSFLHERGLAKGGPDGGDGGHGGKVFFVASNSENTLSNFRFQKEITAEDGKKGGASNMHGRNGKTLEVNVPVGTQVYAAGELIADLVEAGQKVLIADGGKGGFGNAHFTSSVRQAPKFAEKGEPGETFEAVLELKIIADVGLVGLPNAGKSTLLASLSGAKPKIANYPFTTLNPHLGVVKVDKGMELLLADIPGLIDGASEGKGLGDEFLRHVERTSVLLHMIDVYSNDIVADYETIQKELRSYKIDLTQKPQIIAVTKVEGLDADIVADQVETLSTVTGDTPIYAISSLSKHGVKELLYTLHDVVAQEKARVVTEAPQSGIPIIRAPKDESSWKVIVGDDSVRVTGRKIERFALRTDFESEDAVRRLRDIMRKMGIARNIEKKGVEPGVRVYFGQNTEDYITL